MKYRQTVTLEYQEGVRTLRVGDITGAYSVCKWPVVVDAGPVWVVEEDD